MFGFGKGSRELNLIPEEEQKIRTKRIRLITLGIIGLILALQVATFIGILSLEQIEKNTRGSLEEELATKNSQWQSSASPAAQIIVTKNKLTTFNSFTKSHQDPNLNITKIQKSIPTGITLTGLSILNTNEATVLGTAGKPSVIYQFFNTLQDKEGDFDKVELEAVDKVSAGSYNFIIKFDLK